MKRSMYLTLCFLSLIGINQAMAASGDGVRLGQLALICPAQVFDPGTDISGIRLDLVYGVNDSVHGLDLGIVNRTTADQGGIQFGVVNHVNGFFHGVQYGVVNIVGGDFVGIQDGVVNDVKGDFIGIQNGSVNIVEGDFHGLQSGLFFNSVDHKMEGLQIGLINRAGILDDALQIGLLNYNDALHPLGFFPIVNFSF